MKKGKAVHSNYVESDDFQKILHDEKSHLNLAEKDLVSGLAISGGGIRSASFGLGVMQALVNNNQLEKIDYMSTVSGGGYLGSALTWALHLDKEAGTQPHNFPLGKKGTPGGKLDDGIKKSQEIEANNLLDFIRQHGAYLTPSKNLDIISFSAVILRSMVMSLFVYLSFITIAMTFSLWAIYAVYGFLIKKHYFNIIPEVKDGLLLWLGLSLICIVIAKGFLFSLGTFSSNTKINILRYKSFISGQKTIGWMLKIGLTLMAFGSLPYIVGSLDDIENIYKKYLAATGSTVFGSAIGIWQYLKARKNEKNTGGSSDILIYAGAFALFYGILLLAYIFSMSFFLEAETHAINGENFRWFCILAFASLIFGFFVNLNYIGPHFVWRSRLMEAFMPDLKPSIEENKWSPAIGADSAMVADMCSKEKPRPYHIINTNIILSNSPKIDYSGRGGDNFIFSPLYCGSDATGWKRTSKYENDKSRGITLATAMATSAAALNPNAGVSGEGVTRNVVVSILLSVLNLRLGYWTGNPNGKAGIGSPSPNFFRPGLSSEIFRSGLTENDKNILLSDGGHYENLALYELIRRKLDLIIISDGGADPLYNFDDLANVIEKVRVDFGARIYFKPGYSLDAFLPGTAGDSDFQKKYNISKHAFAFARVIYNDKSEGTLVYIKLAMIEGMSTDVYSYKGVNPAFPHQSTSDQFFDEKQFEAYRELGYSVGWQMLLSKEGTKLFGMTLKVENRISINAPVSKVWEALVDPEKTRRYMLGCSAETDWKVNSRLTWKRKNNANESTVLTGTITDIQPNKLLKFTVIDPNASYADIPENHLNITYTLTEKEGYIILTFLQDGFERVEDGEKRYNEIYNNGEEWHSVLKKIKEIVEEG